MLTLSDERNELFQWDTGRELKVDKECSQVHFSNKIYGRSIDVDVVDGIAKIPDVLLQTDKDLMVWAFVGTTENGYTKISKVFKVNRRNKPADYVFTPTDQTSIKELNNRIEKLEANQDPEAVGNAVKEYLENNPIKEEDPTVPQWAKEKEKPIYTADEVGALPKTTKIPSKTSELENDSEFAKQTDVDKLSEEIADLKQNTPSSESALTIAQVEALDGMFKKCAFTGDVTAEYNAFKQAFGIEGGSEEPDTPDEPTTPTLISISAVYTGGDVTEGTALTDLTGITVTAHYSDGSTANVTGYTLSGDIFEGENTITVTYDGKTTTFTVVGIAEVIDTPAELITDGLVNYFDFRTCEYNNAGSGGTTLIQPTQGNGQLYTWANNAVTEQSADYGIKSGRVLMYATDKSTTQASCGDAFTWVFKSYTTVVGSPAGTKDYLNMNNLFSMSYQPTYNKGDGTTAKAQSGTYGERIAGYELVFIVVDENICRIYYKNELVVEVDGNSLDGFTSWYDKLSFEALGNKTITYLSQLAIYNRALTEVEITEMKAYLETLEVA